MKPRSLLVSWLGALLYLAGMLIGLFLSAAVVWGESEARINSSYSADAIMKLSCPLMIAPAESGIIRGEIVNSTELEIKPVVKAELSKGTTGARTSQTFVLPPKESMRAEWVVDSSNVIFDKLILVNILQSQYRDNPSRWGSCAILLFSLFGLTGSQTFALIFGASVLCLLCGAGIWFYFRKPLDNLGVNIAQAGSVLAGMTIAAMLSTFPRWWGLTLFLDAFSLLALGTIFVEFILFPKKEG